VTLIDEEFFPVLWGIRPQLVGKLCAQKMSSKSHFHSKIVKITYSLVRVDV
jgi:hypothetical protein